MLHPSTKKLIDKLEEMTRKRRITWTETQDDRISYATEGYSVVLTAEPQTVHLLDAAGKVLEEVTPEEIAETVTDTGSSYQQLFAEMYREASRQARGTETAIDTVLAGLDLDGDGIPDVPATPDPDAVVEDVAGEAENDAPEDPVEETSAAVQAATEFSPVAQAAETQPALTAEAQQPTTQTTTQVENTPASITGATSFTGGAIGLGGMISDPAAEPAEPPHVEAELTPESTPEPEPALPQSANPADSTSTPQPAPFVQPEPITQPEPVKAQGTEPDASAVEEVQSAEAVPPSGSEQETPAQPVPPEASSFWGTPQPSESPAQPGNATPASEPFPAEAQTLTAETAPASAVQTGPAEPQDASAFANPFSGANETAQAFADVAGDASQQAVDQAGEAFEETTRAIVDATQDVISDPADSAVSAGSDAFSFSDMEAGSDALADATGSFVDNATAATDQVAETAGTITEKVAEMAGDATSDLTATASDASDHATGAAEQARSSVTSGFVGAFGAASAAINPAPSEPKGAAAYPGEAETGGDDEDEITPRPKPTTRFNPWN